MYAALPPRPPASDVATNTRCENAMYDDAMHTHLSPGIDLLYLAFHASVHFLGLMLLDQSHDGGENNFDGEQTLLIFFSKRTIGALHSPLQKVKITYKTNYNKSYKNGTIITTKKIVKKTHKSRLEK